MTHIVTADDEGIRPAGKPDECFYCLRKVGELHRDDCVTVTVVRRYKVILDGKEVGTLSLKEGVELPFDPEDSNICNICSRVLLWPLLEEQPNTGDKIEGVK